MALSIGSVPRWRPAIASRAPRRGSAAIQLLCLAVLASPASPQTPVADFYYHGGDTVAISIHLDSVGVVARRGVPLEDVRVALGAYGLAYRRELLSGISLFSLDTPVSRDSLRVLCALIREREPSVFQLGPVVVRAEGLYPFVLTDQVIVQFQPNVDSSRIDSVHQPLAARRLVRTPFAPNHFLVGVTAESPGDAVVLARAYRMDSTVLSAYPDFLGGAEATAFSPHDTLFHRQWQLHNASNPGADVNAIAAWDVTRGDPAVVIAVVETAGFDITHPDLVNKLWKGAAGEPGWDFYDCINVAPSARNFTQLDGCGSSLQATDEMTHGTAVAGIAAAQTDNTLGIAGMCPNCSLMLLRAGLSVYGKTQAFLYARHHGASVVNVSMGGNAGTDVENAIKSLVTAGIPVVVSMENQDSNSCGNPGDLWSYASLPEVIAVGASNDRDERVLQSSTGSCLDILAPSAIAPSQLGIAATDVTGAGGRNDGSGSAASGCPIAQEVSNPDYTLCFGGTSAAAPLVSGIAGLVRSVKPNLSPAEVEQILRKTADKIPPGANASDVPYDAAGHSTTHGYGRVNAFCALRAAVAPAEPCKPVQTAAAATFEIGTRLGVSWLHNGGDQVVINAPGGGARAAPILSVAWFPTVHWMIDGQVGISFVQNSGIPPDEYRIVAAADLAYVTNPGGVSLYVGPGVGVQRFWSSGGPGSTEFGGGAIAGIRALPRPFLALRLEGAYRYWPAPNLHEFVLAFGFGVVLN